MKKREIFTRDARIQGLVKIDKLDFSVCKKINCIKFGKCTNQKAKDITCIYPTPKFKVKSSKFDLEQDNAGRISRFKKLFNWLRLRKKYPNTMHNDTNQVFLNDLAKHVAGESQPDLQAQFLAFSTAFDAPTKDSILESEIGRVAPSSVNRNNSQVTIEGTFGITDANTLNTTVGAVVDSTQFNINDTTGLAIGDRCQVTLSALGNRLEERKVSNISGSLITLDSALSIAPTPGDTFDQMISRLQLVHGSATSTLNTGSATSIVSYIETKASTDTLNITYEVTFV